MDFGKFFENYNKLVELSKGELGEREKEIVQDWLKEMDKDFSFQVKWLFEVYSQSYIEEFDNTETDELLFMDTLETRMEDLIDAEADILQFEEKRSMHKETYEKKEQLKTVLMFLHELSKESDPLDYFHKVQKEGIQYKEKTIKVSKINDRTPNEQEGEEPYSLFVEEQEIITEIVKNEIEKKIDLFFTFFK